MTTSINRRSRWEPGRGGRKSPWVGAEAWPLQTCTWLGLASEDGGGALWSLVHRLAESGTKKTLIQILMLPRGSCVLSSSFGLRTAETSAVKSG